MNDKASDQILAAEALRRINEAKERLRTMMAEQGLKTADGWTIAEDLRSRPEFTEYIFRPIHRRHPQPELKTSVAIDFDGRAVILADE